tara:strand:- start:850 stop:1191 length:342 start_codon:yes stop_codon:yes gene_type:complete
MIFIACPPIYHLPGTWDDPDKIAKCMDTLIPHGTIDPQYGPIIFICLILLISVVYGIYMTFGSGKQGLRDEIEEHSRMHELGIAHSHKEGSYRQLTKSEKGAKVDSSVTNPKK